MRTFDARTGIERIDRDECLRLLAADEIGRLAIVVGGSPTVFPVNYALDGDTIVFRTDEGTKLRAGPRAPACFEIDSFDREHRTGWDVVATGRLEEVTRYMASALAEAQQLPIGPWAGGAKSHWMRLVPDRITGRRVPPRGQRQLPHQDRRERVMRPEDTATSSLEEIARDECLVLVASMAIGRIAVALPGGPPLVVPVNYLLDGETVVFRTDPGTKLDMLREEPVSFQVDLIDPFHRTGWSVLVQGIADATEHDGDNHAVELESWVGGEKRHWVRVVPAAITGRRIRLPEFPEDLRGYL